MIEEESLVLLHVVRDDAQAEIPLASQRAAVEHFRPVANCALELRERIAALAREPDVHVDHDVETERLAVEQGDSLADHAVLLELLDAPPAGRIRQPEFGRDVRRGQRAVALQLVQDAPVRRYPSTIERFISYL